jgi:hypothetical protein
VAQVARSLGIPGDVLYRWSAQHRRADAHDTTRAAQRAEAEARTRVKREFARVTGHPGAGLFNTCGGILREGIPMDRAKAGLVLDHFSEVFDRESESFLEFYLRFPF